MSRTTRRVRLPGLAAPVPLLTVLALVATGCPRGHVESPSSERVRIRSFTDSEPVNDVAVVTPYLFAISGDEVERFQIATGERTSVLPPDSSGGAVYDLVADPARHHLWIATRRGITRLDVDTGTLVDLPDPPEAMTSSMDHVTMAPAGDGSVYVGGLFGLYRSGKTWTRVDVKGNVTGLAMGGDGSLWIGTDLGLAVLGPGGLVSLAPKDGVDLASVRHVIAGPGDSPVAVGRNAEGQERVVVRVGKAFATYRISPDRPWDELAGGGHRAALVDRSGGVFVATQATGLPKLGRDQLELLPAPPPGAPDVPPSPLDFKRLSGHVPVGISAVAVDAQRVWLGTRDLGIGAADVDGKWHWYRRGDLSEGGRFLSIACVARDDCFLANASNEAWRFDGKAFRDPGLDGHAVEAFVRQPEGQIYALTRQDDGSLGVSSFVDGKWRALDGLRIALPEGKAVLSFARFAPGGLLWLGVGYVDDAGDVRPRGVAIVDVNIGGVSYHHATTDEEAKRHGILPIPINTVDISFLGTDEVWLATTQGAVRVKGTDVKLYSETDGMRSEILRAIGCSAAGMVYVGSRQGVGSYDGETWSYPPSLSTPVNDLRFADDGRLWLGTDSGLTSFDGAKIRRLDSRRGLLEDKVEDIDIDRYGRLWLRTPQSITLVVP